MSHDQYFKIVCIEYVLKVAETQVTFLAIHFQINRQEEISVIAFICKEDVHILQITTFL